MTVMPLKLKGVTMVRLCSTNSRSLSEVPPLGKGEGVPSTEDRDGRGGSREKGGGVPSTGDSDGREGRG